MRRERQDGRDESGNAREKHGSTPRYSFYLLD